MNVLLLAAGKGTRLMPITRETPKCLVKINGKPLIEYWLDRFIPLKSIEKVYINTHYLSNKVSEYLSYYGDKKKIEILFEKRLLGTAGTLKNLINSLATKMPLMLVHADNLSFFSLDSFFSCYHDRPMGCELTLMTFKTDTPKSCGLVGSNENGIMTSFAEKPEKPKHNIANGAVCIISPRALSKISTMAGAVDFSRDILPKFIGKTNVWHNSEYHRDIGTPIAYKQAQAEIKLRSNLE